MSIGRRSLIVGMAGIGGGLGAARPDQHYEPPAGGQAIPGPRAVVRARTVIIFGTGPTAGLFAYSPTPGPNKLIASITGQGGTDPYGNATLAGVTNYQVISGTGTAVQLATAGVNFYRSAAALSGPWVPLGSIIDGQWQEPTGVNGLNLQVGTGAAQFQIATNGSQITETVPLSQTANVNAPVLSVENFFSGPSQAAVAITSQTAGDRSLSVKVAGDTNARCQMQSTGTLDFGSGSAAPDTHIYRSGVHTLASATTAFDKGLGVAETWQVPTFANGWANAASGANLQYRLLSAPFNTMQWVGRVVVPVGFAAGQGINVAVPSNYQPVHPQPVLAVNLTNGGLVRFQMGTGGVLLYESGATVAGDIIDIQCGAAIVSLDA